MNSSPSSVSGFTLTELMIVVLVAGILATLAVPSYTSMAQSQRVKNASFEMYTLISIARSEAVKRNGDVTIARVASPDRFTVTAGGTLLYSKPVPNGVDITTSVAGITYQRSGRTTAAGADATFQIDVEGASPPTTHVRCITLELSGVPSTRKGAC